MQREPIEVAAMNLCRDLSIMRSDIHAIGLDRYWDYGLTPGAREVYRKAARNAHAALVDQGAVQRVREHLDVLNVVHPEVNSISREFKGASPFREPVDLTVADLRALVTRPIESEEESVLSQAVTDFYGQSAGGV